MANTEAGPPLTAEYIAANRSTPFVALVVIFPILALLVVSLRMYTRLRIIHSPSHDDWAIVAAMIFSIGTAVCQGIQFKNGVGRHIQALSLAEALTLQKALFASIICYNFALTFTKISILLQYLRIAIERPHKIVCWIFLWFIVIYCIETLFAGIFQCVPVAKFWDTRIPGHCVNTFALYYANAGINIATDIMLVVLPFFILRTLILPKREKISLMIVLGLGGFASIASICRLKSMHTMGISTDVTWDSPGAAAWSAIELNTGILCASLPTLRAFFVKHWPRAFFSSFRKTGQGESNTKGQYYNMEGSILVKKSIAVETTKDVENGNSCVVNGRRITKHDESGETSSQVEMLPVKIP